MRRYPFVLPVLALSVGVCLSEEPVTFGRGTGDSEETRSCVTITQKTCRVFGSATDKMIDRMRLRESAVRAFVGVRGTNSAERAIHGMRVERMTYFGSNQVEAVFSCDRTSRR